MLLYINALDLTFLSDLMLLLDFFPSIQAWKECFEAYRPFTKASQTDGPAVADVDPEKLKVLQALDEAAVDLDQRVRFLCSRLNLDVDAIWLNVPVVRRASSDEEADVPLRAKICFWLETHTTWSHKAEASKVYCFLTSIIYTAHALVI